MEAIIKYFFISMLLVGTTSCAGKQQDPHPDISQSNDIVVTATNLPTQTPLPTQKPFTKQKPIPTEPVTEIVVTPETLPKLGESVHCKMYDIRVLENQPSKYFYFDYPPSGIYNILYVEITNTQARTLVGISLENIQLYGWLQGIRYSYHIYPVWQSNWLQGYWWNDLKKPGSISYLEPYYPSIPSKTFFLFDVHPDAKDLVLEIPGCDQQIFISPNDPKIFGINSLAIPLAPDKQLLADYEEIDYWNDDVILSLKNDKKVILRGVVGDVKSEDLFNLEIAGTWTWIFNDYMIRSTEPLDRIYSGESVTVYGYRKNAEFIAEFMEVTKSMR